MDRKEFLRKGVLGIGGIIAVPSLLTSCGPPPGKAWDGTGTCPVSPEETDGPFPSHSPAELVKQNIVGDRVGIPLTVTLTIKKQSNNCEPYPGVVVDIWQCDADGNYSEYGGSGIQQKDYKQEHFLRGRQTTNENGQVSYQSIFPGWYQNRATHIHVEISDASGKTLLITQIAFPKETCDKVYATERYHGPAATTNEQDDIFNDSLAGNMADNLTGDLTSGFVLNKTINVA